MCKNEKQVVVLFWGKIPLKKIVTIVIKTICLSVNGVIDVMSQG
jgi:hypothetical protein